LHIRSDDQRTKEEEQGTREPQFLWRNLISVLRFGNVNRDLDSTVQNAGELQVADGGFWCLCPILFVAEKNA
jgi:hypothetical protein